MKKIIGILLALVIFLQMPASFAIETIQSEFDTKSATKALTAENTQAEIVKSGVIAPKWEDYVAPKYRDPRTDFSYGGAAAETSVGGLLTALIITIPVGIPLMCHGITKFKMLSYANRKRIFENEIEKSQTLKSDAEKLKAYSLALKRAHLKESTRRHYEIKNAKKARKEQKKEEKLQKKYQKQK